MTSELPDVWLAEGTLQTIAIPDLASDLICPSQEDADSMYGKWHHYLPASRIASLEARNARLVEALRRRVIQLSSAGWKGARYACVLCHSDWAIHHETHAPGCILADSEAEKGEKSVRG